MYCSGRSESYWLKFNNAHGNWSKFIVVYKNPFRSFPTWSRHFIQITNAYSYHFRSHFQRVNHQLNNHVNQLQVYKLTCQLKGSMMSILPRPRYIHKPLYFMGKWPSAKRGKKRRLPNSGWLTVCNNIFDIISCSLQLIQNLFMFVGLSLQPLL